MASAGEKQARRELARKSWSVVKENRYLLAFPVSGLVFALVPIAIFGIPALVFLAMDRNWLAALFGVLALFGIQFVVTLMAAGLVAAADEELHGRDSSYGQGLGRAMGRFGAVLQWSAVLTVVSLLLSLLRGNNSGDAVGNILRSVAAATAGVMWTLITFFVLPIIVLEKTGVFPAIKDSALLFKQHWGTQILGGVRIFLPLVLVFFLPGLATLIGGVLLLGNGPVGVAVALLAITALLWTIAGLLGSTVRGIFSVALYRFAKDGTALASFTPVELQSAVRVKAA